MRSFDSKAVLVLALVLALAFASATANATICVVNLERPKSPITRVVDKVFVGAPDVELHDGAGPQDLLGCIRTRATEIVLIGHALENEATLKNNAANLGYFTQLTGDALKSELRGQIQELGDQVTAITDRLRSEGLDQAERTKLTAERSRLENLINRYRKWPPGKEAFLTKPLLPKVMEVAREELNRQAKTLGSVSLKRFRLMSCLPQLVLNQYDQLRALLKVNSIQLDIAPSNPVASWLDGQPVTTPDIEWLAKSVDRWALKSWSTDQNPFCREDYWPGCDRRTARFCLPVKR